MLSDCVGLILLPEDIQFLQLDLQEKTLACSYGKQKGEQMMLIQLFALAGILNASLN